MKDDVKLPPLPEGDIYADTCPAIKVHTDQQLQDYARLAIKADRKRRSEPVDTDLVQKWQREHGVVLTPGSREAAMVVIRHDEDGKPTVWCDPEIADLVRALNDGGVATVASCSGHGHRPGNIMLADGRVLVVCRDADEACEVESRFPGINGEAQQPAKPVRVPSDEDIERLASEHLSSHAQFVGAGEVHYEGEIEFARALLARYGRPVEPEGWQLVPKEPDDDQWGNLARDIIKAWDFGIKRPRELFKFLERSGTDIPQWLRDEPEMKNLDHTPSKGTRAVLIYKAMLAAAPKFGEEEWVG